MQRVGRASWMRTAHSLSRVLLTFSCSSMPWTLYTPKSTCLESSSLVNSYEAGYVGTGEVTIGEGENIRAEKNARICLPGSYPCQS